MTQERDLALLERNQLQGKLENLEQVLKVRNTVLPAFQRPARVELLRAAAPPS